MLISSDSLNNKQRERSTTNPNGCRGGNPEME